MNPVRAHFLSGMLNDKIAMSVPKIMAGKKHNNKATISNRYVFMPPAVPVHAGVHNQTGYAILEYDRQFVL